MKAVFCARVAMKLLVGVSALSLGGVAFAADEADQEATNDQGQLEQIVVTAQKVSQNLQDVPLAVSAISAEKVGQLGIRDAKDLTGLKSALAAPGALIAGHEWREQGTARHIGTDRQGGHPGLRRQGQPDQAVDGDEGDVVGQEQALAQGQQEQLEIHGAPRK